MTLDEIVTQATESTAKGIAIALSASREAGRREVLDIIRGQITCPPADACDACLVLKDALTLVVAADEVKK